MSTPAGWLVCGILLIVPWGICGEARADLIKLKGGGEIRGELQRKRGRPAEDGPLAIRTLTGGVIHVASEDVQFVTRRSLVVEEYETLRKLAAGTVDGQWEVAEWCRQHGLKKERETHLEAIVALDPQHEAAHRGLGHVRHEGQWTSPDELMESKGYVKYKGRYVLPQELELIERNTQQTEAERSWFKKVHVWHGWLVGKNPERAGEAYHELDTINDSHAVPALVHSFRDEPNEPARVLFVKLLTRLGGSKAFEALVNQSLLDASATVRRMALDSIPPQSYSEVIPLYLKALRHDLNQVVLRAAAALQEIGDAQTIPPLIDALVTTHRYRVQVRTPSGQSIGFTPGGQMLTPGSQAVLPAEIEAGLLTGQYPNGVIYQDATPPPPGRVRTVTIQHNHQNAEVLGALKRLSGEDFGYDKRTWKLWWASQKSGNKVP